MMLMNKSMLGWPWYELRLRFSEGFGPAFLMFVHLAVGLVGSTSLLIRTQMMQRGGREELLVRVIEPVESA